MSKKRNKKKKSKKMSGIKRDLFLIKQAVRTKNPVGLDLINEYVYQAWIEHGELVGYATYLKYTSEWYTWKKDDLCICGSKKYIFDCHLKDVKQKVDLHKKRHMYSELIKETGQSPCSFKNCDEIAIKSHVVPRNILKRIGLKLEETNLLGSNNSLKGNREISYKYYCSKHDNDIYEEVDDLPFELNHNNISLFSTKASISEEWAKKLSIKNTKKLCLKEPEFLIDPMNINALKEQPIGLRDIDVNRKEMLSNESRALFFEYKIAPEFAGWAFFNLSYDPFTGKALRKYGQLDVEEYKKEVWPAMSCVVTPWSKTSIGFFLTLSHHKSLDDIWKRISSNDEDMLAFFFVSITNGDHFYQSDNVDKTIKEAISENIKFEKRKNNSPWPKFQEKSASNFKGILNPKNILNKLTFN